MSEPHPTLPALDEPGDAELISAVRAGDLEAYGTLFERHVEAARRLARQLVSAGDVDDLVSDAFSKVLGVLQRGGGPDLAFRAYLLTSLRRLHVDKLRAGAKLTTTDDMTAYDPGVPFEDTAVAGFDNETAAKAFARLPERWQQVLWHTEVEGQKPAEIAPLLGMSPNSVSALAYRAREGLRQAFISMHAQDAVDETCSTTRANLGAYIRNGLSRRDSAKVEAHLQDCRACTAIYLELTEVNSNLGALLAPLLLGTAGAGYLAAAATGTKAGILLFFGGVKNWLLHNPAGRATGIGAGVAAAAVAVAAVAAGGGGNEPHKPTAEPPPAATPQQPAATPAPPATPAKTPKTPKKPPATTPSTAPSTTPPPVTTAPSTPPGPSSPSTPSSPSSPTPTPEKDPIITTPIPTVTITPGANSVTIDLTHGATDPNGDPLTVRRATVAKPAHGTVTKDRSVGRLLLSGGGGKSGLGGAVIFARPVGVTTVTYTPQKGWRGTDTIDYTLTDGHGGTVSGTVKVTTPDRPPVAGPIDVDAVPGWNSVLPKYLWPLRHTTDANGDNLTFTITQPKHGRAVQQPNGRVDYFAELGFANYTDHFTYTVSDGHGGRATGRITVRVGQLPDRAPVAAKDSATVADDDQEGESIPVLANDTDPDGDHLAVKAVNVPSDTPGKVTVNKDAQGVTYHPTFGDEGHFSFGYTVSDGRGETDTARVSLTVTPISQLMLRNDHDPSIGSGEVNTRFVVDGIPSGRHATFKLSTDAFAGFTADDSIRDDCTVTQDVEPQMSFVCHLTSADNGAQLAHLDFDLLPGGTYAAVVRAEDFTSADAKISGP